MPARREHTVWQSARAREAGAQPRLCFLGGEHAPADAADAGHPQVALEAQEERKYNRLFAGFYVQPELLEAARLIKDKEAHRKFSVRDDAAIEDTAADLAVVSAAACGGIGTAAAM